MPKITFEHHLCNGQYNSDKKLPALKELIFSGWGGMDKSKKTCYTSGGYDGLRKKEPSEMTKNDGKRMVRKGSSELRPEGSEEVNHVEMWRKNVSY